MEKCYCGCGATKDYIVSGIAFCYSLSLEDAEVKYKEQQEYLREAYENIDVRRRKVKSDDD